MTDEKIRNMDYLAIIENLPYANYWFAENKIYLGANLAHVSNLGLKSYKDIIGKSIFNFVPELKTKFFNNSCKEALLNNRKVSIFYNKVLKNGDLKRINITITPIHLKNKKNILLVSEHGVESLNRADAVIRLAGTPEEKIAIYFNNVINNLPANIYWKNKDCVIIGDNLTHAQMCGYQSTDDVVGKTDYEFPWREQADEIIANDREVMRTKKTQTFEETGALLDGSKHVFLTKKSPVIDQDGEVIGLLGISVDITEQKMLEKELQETKAREEQFKAMSTLGGMIAHELKTPLSSIKLALTSIRKKLSYLVTFYKIHKAADSNPLTGEKLDELEQSLDNINQSIIYSKNTIQTILTGFHHSGSVDNVRLQEFSLLKMLNLALDQFSLPTDIKNKMNINISEEISILGEPSIFIHVIHNLLKNALYAMHSAGKGNIKVWAEASNDNIKFYFEDNAIGIKKEDLKQIFKPFYTTKKRTAASIGLGLYFCKMALNKMKASIACESELGKYTRFVITF